MAIILSAPAEKDIASILRYTLEKWGNAQFENYFELIQTNLAEIDADPNCLTCRQREELFVGGRAKSFGKHIIFYRIVNSRVEVVPILHQTMDHRSHS